VAGAATADNPLPLAKVYLQKDPLNIWQAGSADWSAAPVNVHWIDWGDNLESVDWYTRSQVRTEIVLFQDLTETEQMTEYAMRHTSGWGIDEVHGLEFNLTEGIPQLGPGTRATVYSHCARLTIQKLLVDRSDSSLADLIWVPGEGWTEPAEDPENPGLPYPDDLVNPPIFNDTVYQGGDGPGYYSAEINVKGRIIYGYTWNVRKLNDTINGGEAAGDYRITFSFDETCGTDPETSLPVQLNTFFEEGTTSILVPLETEESIEAAFRASCIPTFPEFCRLAAFSTAEEGEEPGGGATGVLVPAQFDGTGMLIGGNFTYMDVRILERGGGKP